MNELVSVVIPTYNRSQFVTEAIDSVLNQTYPNIELIVVNDGSIDNTEEKLQPYMNKIIYVKKENGGTSSAVNAGLRIAKGKYIARLDDDDLFMPDKVEKQVRLFEDNPDVGLVTSGCFAIDAVGRIISVVKAPDFSKYGPFLSSLLQYSVFQPTVMVRRECHDKLGLYRNIFAEEFEMFLRIMRYWNVGIIDQPLAKFRRHSGNITVGLPNNKEFQQNVRDFLRDILDDVRLTELFPALDSTADPYRKSCAYAAKGSLYLKHRIFDRAETNLIKALKLRPTNGLVLLWLGILARTQGKFQSAEEYFARIQKSDELYLTAQDARDLITAIQKNPDENSLLLRNEILREHAHLFNMTFDGISGEIPARKSTRSSVSNGLKLSRYALTIDDYPQNGKHLVFNTFTHAMVNISDDLKGLIENSNRPAEEDSLKDLRMLKKMGIVVDRESDETKLARTWYDMLRHDTSRMHITILTTYDCNFACKYCIEEGVKKPIYMSDECSDSLVDWLINKVEKDETKELSVSFYGGEPLLNTKPIYKISERLQRFAVDSGILFRSSITTNGSLMDGQLLQDLTKCGLTTVKVTIDGEREVHDLRRPFKDGRGSFDAIIESIWKIPETVKLNVQTNLDEENVAGFPYLLDFFESSGLKCRMDNLTISSVSRSLGPTSMSAAQGVDCVKLPDSQIGNELTYMKKLIVKRGFKSRYDSINYVICGMNRNGAFVVIDSLGDIYSCPAFVGRGEFSIGDIYHPELDLGKEISAVELERCFRCTYFPTCGGGCRYISHILYGDCTKISCEKGLIGHQTRELVKFIYDQKVKSRQKAIS